MLDTAATDFHEHPPAPARFRHVRMGHVMRPDGAKQYMLCGEFLPAQEQGETEWISFVTIKTDPYEQWLGSYAAGLCQQSSMVWDDGEDLSSVLQSRFESLQ